MSDFMAGFMVGVWLSGIVFVVWVWIAKSCAHKDPKPWE